MTATAPTRPASSDVVCAGILVADTFVPVIPALPAAGDLLEVGEFVLDAGGCAANTAISLATLGVEVSVAATVGDDVGGRFLADTLADRGVRTNDITRSATRGTSRTVILTVDGEDRRYLHSIGANADLDAAAIESAIAGARVLVLGGYLVLPGLRAAELAGVLERARAAGTRTILDVVIPRGRAGVVDELRPVLPHVDLFLPNRDEAVAITGADDPVAQADVFLSWGAGAVVVTCGADGAVYVDADRVLDVAPYPVEMVDGSGAGDAFTAGLTTGIVADWPIETSLRFASAVGASACRGLGCTTTLFSRDEALAAAADVTVVERTRAG